jgi:hypothetical protein
MRANRENAGTRDRGAGWRFLVVNELIFPELERVIQNGNAEPLTKPSYFLYHFPVV